MRLRFVYSISLSMLLGSLWLVAQVKDFRPVTESMLRNSARGDWLNWRRTDNAWGYSPLDQIDRLNVKQLQLAWSWEMDDMGVNEATPLVYDGIMYLPNPHGVIQALDGATGDLIWEYRPEAAQSSASAPSVSTQQQSCRSSPSGPQPRGVALKVEGSRETSRSMATRFLEPRATRISSLSRRGQENGCGTLRSPIPSWGTNTRPAQLSFAAR
jgi:hypothetical protein